jgi:hypothetical protein
LRIPCTCATLAVRRTNAVDFEKWATPTFLLVYGLMEN